MVLLAALSLALPARAADRALSRGSAASDARGAADKAPEFGGEQDFAAARLDIERTFSEIEFLVKELGKLEDSYATTPDLEALRPVRQELHDRALQGLTRVHEKISRYDKAHTEFELLNGSRLIIQAVRMKETLPPQQLAKDKRNADRAIADGSIVSAFGNVYDLRQYAVDSFARLSKDQGLVEREQATFERALQAQEKARKERTILLGGVICLPLLLGALALARRRLLSGARPRS